MQIVLPGINGSGELWLDIMKIICGDTSHKSMIDLGCHKAPYTPLLGFKERVYVDIQGRLLDDPNEQKYFIQDDVLGFLYYIKKRYDVAIASDFIEHVSVEKGYEFLAIARLQSKKQIIFTPLGEYMISDDDHPDSHRSGWTPEMLPIYLSIVLPDFHPILGIGAFFAVNCSDEEKQRIINEIKNKYVKDSGY